MRSPSGKLVGREAKNGPNADLTNPQQNGFPELSAGEATAVVSFKPAKGVTIAEAEILAEIQAEGLPIRTEFFGTLWETVTSIQF